MLKYKLDEPNAGLGIRLKASDSDFPNFFFSSRDVDDRTFIIEKRVYYKNKQKDDSNEPLGTDTERVRAYKRAYTAAINYADSLGLKVDNTINAKRLEYLTETTK
jgi:hypothetical protein